MHTLCRGETLITDYIKKKLLNALPKKTFNIHSGLTQKFRGYACNFWACYFLEPNNVGATLHYVIQKVDREVLKNDSSTSGQCFH